MANEAKSVLIHCDSRESRSGIADRLALFPGVTIETSELSSGDYLVGNGTAVERKAPDDFVLSVMSGHLFDQLARMLNEHERAVVLVEGSPYTSRSEIAPESIDGALSYITLLSGASLAFSPSLQATPRVLWRMALHQQWGLGYSVPLRAEKPRAPSSIAQYLVAGLPGVGSAVAKRLLGHFGSARAVFAADVQMLCQVKGIGKKSAEAIVAALEGHAGG